MQPGEETEASITITGSQESGETCVFRVESDLTNDSVTYQAKVGTDKSLCTCAEVTPSVSVSPKTTIKQGQDFDFAVSVPNTSQKDDLVTIIYGIRHYGLGQSTWHEIGRFEDVAVPAGETVEKVLHWTPDIPGHMCLQVRVINDCAEKKLHRNLNVIEEAIQPCTSVEKTFKVGNPLATTEVVSLTLIQDKGTCTASLNQAQFVLQPGEEVDASITITGSQQPGETCEFRVVSELTNDERRLPRKGWHGYELLH